MTKKRLFVLIFTFSFCFIQAFAAEKNDGDVMSLSQIDVLIKETRYDQALEELNKYIIQNPENFDNAQARIERIMLARNRYSRLAEELIQLIIDEPDNSEKIYKITSELEHLEKYPSDRQLAFIRETRIAAEFNYFRKEYIRLHEETENLVHSGQYMAAARKAREGFELYQERFFDEWSQEDVVSPVKTALLNIDESLINYDAIQKRITESVDAFVRAVDEEKKDEISTAWLAVQTDFMEFAVIRNQIYESGETFKNTFEYMKSISEEELTDASFLPFVTRFTVGQTDNADTGIAGVMNSQWYSSMNRMKSAVSKKLQVYENLFAASLPEEIMTSSLSELNLQAVPNIQQYSNLAIRVNALNFNLSPDIYESDTVSFESECSYGYQIPVKIQEMYSLKQNVEARFNVVKSVKEPESPAKAELERNSFCRTFLNEMAKVPLVSSEEEFLKSTEAFEVNGETLIAMKQKFQNYASEISDSVNETLRTGSERFCDYLKTAGVEFLEQSRNDYSVAKLLFDGDESSEKSIIEKYPEKSLSESAALNSKIDRQIEVISGHIALLPELQDISFSESTRNELNSDIEKLNELKSSSSELASLCRTQIQNAQRARNEAELRFNQAESALRQDNFDVARTRLQNARTKYNEALALSFSEELQNRSDELLIQLGERINQKENEYVVSDVRRLKTQAKNEYYAGNFEAAENYLTQASARWAVTNVEEDLEITGLRALVTSALSMKTGRVILPSAPLYPEMSQILSVASQYYTEGSDLIKKGNSEEGIAQLQHALQKIQEVQLVYPLNQEASLLSLRIQKVLSPNDFDQMFARKVSEAKATYKNKDKQQQSYADLLDLYEINSKYPGLKELIYDVELEIGIRQRPVTKVVSNKASELTKEAQSIFNRAKGNEDELRKALAKLDEAISLDPNNSSAINLKDKIQVSIGGKAAAVLSAEDESRYQVAILELQRNNLITANAIVEQLLQKDSNKNSTKILELRKKIKALL
ncbi:MAG: hypothetical protein MJ182_01300 [Treponema sp.]|nr:hypothetical protein [Treponema sp.]